MTVSYLMDVASQAGIESVLMRIDDIGWDEQQNCFVDLNWPTDTQHLQTLSLGMVAARPYANQLLSTYTLTQWIEPIWKMLLSNKAHPADPLGTFPRPSESTGMPFQPT